MQVRVLEMNGVCVYEGSGKSGSGKIENVKLWSVKEPNLYQLEVRLKTGEAIEDAYTETFGFREISIENCRILLNGEPVYLKGFGKHEEGGTRGRGTDLALMTKDLGLLKWIHANSFRTSHYPNSEEMMRGSAIKWGFWSLTRHRLWG